MSRSGGIPVLILLLGAVTSALSQTPTATLVGTLQDATSGAGTHQQRRAATEVKGEFTIPNLAPPAPFH
jgi:hypothetical protein